MSATSRKAIVLYDTLFGNTEKIARALAKGLELHGVQTTCINIKDATINNLPEYDLIAIGAPTQILSASKPMKEFLSRLKTVYLKDKEGFTFDTRIDNMFAGSAAKYIEKEMKKSSMKIITPHSSAIVIGRKEKSKETKPGDAELKEGMETVFEKIGEELGNLLIREKIMPQAAK